MEMPAWLPWMVVLQPAGGNTHTITMLLPVGSEIEYLYTRSSWDSVERGDACTSIPNRELTLMYKTICQFQRRINRLRHSMYLK
jgi:hypothetical protein